MKPRVLYSYYMAIPMSVNERIDYYPLCSYNYFVYHLRSLTWECTEPDVVSRTRYHIVVVYQLEHQIACIARLH